MTTYYRASSTTSPPSYLARFAYSPASSTRPLSLIEISACSSGHTALSSSTPLFRAPSAVGRPYLRSRPIQCLVPSFCARLAWLSIGAHHRARRIDHLQVVLSSPQLTYQLGSRQCQMQISSPLTNLRKCHFCVLTYSKILMRSSDHKRLHGEPLDAYREGQVLLSDSCKWKMFAQSGLSQKSLSCCHCCCLQMTLHLHTCSLQSMVKFESVAFIATCCYHVILWKIFNFFANLKRSFYCVFHFYYFFSTSLSF